MRPIRSRSFAALVLLALTATGLPACRNDDALNEVRDQQRQILAKLSTLDEKVDRVAGRAAVPPRPAGPDPERAYNVPVSKSPVKGPDDAPITIVEFSDYQCPFCARSEPLIKEALAAYPTQARLVYKHFPLVAIHPQAMGAALAAAAAQRQGKFWEMHDLLFDHQEQLSTADLEHYAEKLKLDLKKWKGDLEIARAKVARDRAEGERLDISGTPTIYINGRKYKGPLRYEDVKDWVDEELVE